MAMQAGRHAKNDPDASSGVHELSVEEGWEMIDRESQRRLGLSGRDFVAAWDRGEYAGESECQAAYEIAMMLPFVRRESMVSSTVRY